MMNALALFLVFTSLVRPGLLTPTPENHNSKDDVALKEGHTHAAVVIEFEKDDGNTKVSISPKDSHPPHDDTSTNVKEKLSGKMEEAKEKIKEAASTILGEDGEETHQRLRPRELICDAYGKCKHKIASAMGKAKEVVAETAQEAAEKVYAMEEETKEAVGEAVGKVKDTVTDAAYKASDKAHQVKDAATQVSSKAKDKAVEKANEMKQGAKEGVYDVIEATTKAKEEAKEKAFKKMEGAKEKAKEAQELVGSASDRVKHMAKKEGRKGLKGIFQHAGGVLGYVGSPVRMDSVGGVLHLLGFAAAYGMGLWVTFASNYVLAGALPRYQFAMVQSKIYPVYFKAMAYSVGAALLGHLMSQRKKLSPLSMGMLLPAFNLMASFVMTLVNLLYLEPRATKVMFERMKKEKEEGSRGRGKEGQATEPSGRVVESTTETAAGRGPGGGGATTTEEATQQKLDDLVAKPEIRTKSSEILLRRLNSYSSLLNVVTLMSLTGHLVCLG
ncbi:Transmembrane protein [Sesamum angolense]|uniref:Transmembrane protein n=1 Tax=Sesamum angolense TaxID=2727404 RepID=A0AAE1WWU6_9LAMI|nr:Transmembrane protein [Sesamum angolense]